MTATSSTTGTNYAVTDYNIAHTEHCANAHNAESISHGNAHDGSGDSNTNSDFATVFSDMLSEEQAQATAMTGASGGLGGIGASAVPTTMGMPPISMPGMPGVFGIPGVNMDIGSTTMEQALMGAMSNTQSSNDQMAMVMLMMVMMMQSGEGGGDMSMFQMMLSALLPQLDNASQNFQQNFTNNQQSATQVLSATNNQSGIETNTANGMTTSSIAGFGSATMPLNVSLPVIPVITSNINNRSPERYRAVIDQFQVETAERYRPGRDGFTYCNIFVLDVVRAMGAHIPHLGAINMCNWLGTTGRQHGWREVDAATAQAHANMGRPAVTSAGSIGHVQMVVPSRTPFNPQVGVSIAQAGRINTNYAPISTIYGANTLQNRIRYFIHD